MHLKFDRCSFTLQGCISISMSLHQTSFCFVCSHLASGEKEGDELKRNADVAEILKSTQFPKICKHRPRRAPERIVDHECVRLFLLLLFFISNSVGVISNLLTWGLLFLILQPYNLARRFKLSSSFEL
jgi:hypothetical protein